MITATNRDWLGRLALGILIFSPLAGCEPKLDSREYGEIVHEVPKFKGSNKPYPLPQLKEPKDETEKVEK